MAKMFISAVTEDRLIAIAVQYLISEELKVSDEIFLATDPTLLFAGERWLDRIEKELQSASVLISIFTMRAVTRPWINFETGAAWIRGIPIIPCCVHPMRGKHLPHPYTMLQAIDLPDIDAAYHLVRSVHHHLGLTTPMPDDAKIRREQRAHSEGMARQAAGRPLPATKDGYDMLDFACRTVVPTSAVIVGVIRDLVNDPMLQPVLDTERIDARTPSADG